jgi:CheY-like chemotaxis protein
LKKGNKPMNKSQIYLLLQESVRELAKKSDLFTPLPKEFKLSYSLDSIGLDPILLPDILKELKVRFAGHDFSDCFGTLENMHTLDDLLACLQKGLGHGISDPCMVYIDDEDSNLFVFKRRFDKFFTIKYFTDPSQALAFILNEPSVALVLTDEVMPGMTGNELCDKVHELKPMLKFILLTGNPNDQEDLMYNSMRKNRFFDFLRKPLDFENHFEELHQLFSSVLEVETEKP